MHVELQYIPGLFCYFSFIISSRVASAFVARNPTYQVDCIDWIGWGLSTHPSDMIVSRKDFMGSIKEFTSCLEEWRRAEQLPKLTFFAHSLGGYLSTWYARTYPTNVERLVLLSAIGQPDKPDEETIKARRSTLPFWAKLLMNSASCLVNTFGMTPMTPLRIAGPWGPNATKGWVERRFSANCLEPLPPSFDDYLYNFNALPSCGEGIVTVCLDTTAHAHYPMSDWLLNDQGKFEGIANTVDELPPITFVHGQQDWVRPDVAFLASKKHPHRVNTFILEKSGHQLFIENPKGFTAMMEWVLNSHPGQLQPNMPPMFEAPPPMRQSDK